MKSRKKAILTDFLVVVFILQSVFATGLLDAYALRPQSTFPATSQAAAYGLKEVLINTASGRDSITEEKFSAMLSSEDEDTRFKAVQKITTEAPAFAWSLLSKRSLKEHSRRVQVAINEAFCTIMHENFMKIEPRNREGSIGVLNSKGLDKILRWFVKGRDSKVLRGSDGNYHTETILGTYSTLTSEFSEDIQNILSGLAKDVVSVLSKNTAVYNVLPDIYHISIAVLQESAGEVFDDSAKLSDSEREALTALLKDIAGRHELINLQLKGIRFGDDGGIIAVWQDNSEIELLRKEFFERGVLITPKIRNTRPKPFLYTTLARILQDISPEELKALKKKALELRDLSYMNLAVKLSKLRIIYETKWMGEEYNDIETIEFGNSKALSAGEALVITIDGPSGAGKSTAAKEIAKRLQARFISYGKYYRLITWLAINEGIELSAKLSDENKQALVVLAESVDMSKLNNIDYGTRYNYKGKDITDIFYSQDVAGHVAFVSQVSEVRKVLVAKLKALIKSEKRNGRSSVLEGRVTGVEIAPDADVKIFLTANLNERSKRRAKEIVGKKGLKAAYAELVDKKPQAGEDLMREIISAVKTGIQDRDYRDKARKHAPAVVAVDAINIDSSRLTKEQTVDTVLGIIKKHKSDSHYKFAMQEAAGLKDIILKGRLQQFIIDAENLENRDIAKIAHMAANLPDRSVVFIAGYSCSGKTTFATRLKKLFQLHDELGKTATELNIDRYYRNHEDMRKDKRLLAEEGLVDFDAPEALDLDLVASHISKLVAGETIEEPNFDMAKGIRTTKTTPIRMEENGILFVEGTHALHPLIVSAVNPENRLCIFVTVTPRLRLSNNTILTPEDSRLMRRIVRDAEKRGIPAINTLRQWPVVLKAEAEHILPTIDIADLIEDTALAYETAVLKKPLMVYLKAAHRQAINEPEIVFVIDRLMGILGDVPEAGYTNIPANSILREFISEEPVSENRIHGFIEKSFAILPLIKNVRIDNQILQAA